MDHVLSHITPSRTDWLKRLRIVGLWLEVWRERRQLARLDPHLLADIGVSPAEACAEAGRPAWDVPEARVDRRLHTR